MNSKPSLHSTSQSSVVYFLLTNSKSHMLNMEEDLQSLFGLHVTWCAQLYSLAETPQLPAVSLRIWTRITRALLVSKGRRHLVVTPCQKPISFCLHNPQPPRIVRVNNITAPPQVSKQPPLTSHHCAHLLLGVPAIANTYRWAFVNSDPGPGSFVTLLCRYVFD